MNSKTGFKRSFYRFKAKINPTKIWYEKLN